jgi:hypothetical protein
VSSGMNMTARARREVRKASLSRTLAKLLFDHDVTQTQLADATGAREDIAQRWCDKNRAETIPLADVPAVADANQRVAEGLLTWAASQIGMRLVRDRVASTAASLHSLLRDTEEAMHGVRCRMLDALAPDSDGGTKLSAAELRDLREKVRGLGAMAAEAELAIDAALSEHEPTRGGVC